ncbi:MAG TPA: hypothetical protein VGL10_00615 [Gammaproteobacteria bacterium]
MNKFLILAVLGLNIPSAHAEWALGGYFGTMSFHEGKAAEEGIKDSALMLGAIAEYFSESLLMVSTGIAFIAYDDNEEFDQDVEVVGGFDDGDIENADSSATAAMLHVDMGPRFHMGESKSDYFAIKGGFSSFLTSERSISNCSNCREEDIEIDGGGYIQTALGIGSNSLGVAFRYSHYLDEEKGISNSLEAAVTGYF